MAEVSKYWFAAKRYGWGWGSPLTWQGWIVYTFFFAAVLFGAALLRPRQHPVGFLTLIVGLSVALIGICYWKGERPRWHWGN